MSANPFVNFDLTTLDGRQLSADELAEQTLLFVNVASRCGLTPQYRELVALAAETAEAPFQVIGVPCNQFGAQEPGSAEEILSFCSTTYGVDFPLLTKRDVNGATRSKLYAWLIGSEAGGGDDIQWNFGKFLVHKGSVVKRFSPDVSPQDDGLLSAVADLLDN